ncbi:sigma-70 family RNA polymerase sigma factor [Brassicibacter mesophilus]|uniref:sigma-70 family RNA polymerase sigma factor n=1 Tax=Brassicibacter mesophilus TaxID=745119 RepID=UPI003D1AA72E
MCTHIKEGVVLEEIVKRAIEGDEESFLVLIKSRKDNIYKVAYSFVNNEQDALDIVQESVYKAYISIKKLKHPEYFNTWLTKIVKNCSINFINKSKKVIYIDKDMSENIVQDSKDIAEEMDLKTALNQLDIKYKTVIILRYFQDLTLKEISELLEIPLNTVKTQLYRALEKLKIELKEEGIIEK